MADPWNCQLDANFRCTVCDKQWHGDVIATCPKGVRPEGWRRPLPIILNLELAREREESHCQGCFFFRTEREMPTPSCALMDCPTCNKNSPPDVKAAARAKKWVRHLANPKSSCLLSEKPKWGPEDAPLYEAAKDYAQINACGVEIDVSQVQPPSQ